MSHGLNKNESKGSSINKSKVFKFKRAPNQSKPPQETQKGRSLFVFGKVKTKKTLDDSDKVSNAVNKAQKKNHFSVVAISSQRRLWRIVTRSQMSRIRDAGGK